MAQQQAKSAAADTRGTTAELADWLANRASAEITDRARLWAKHCVLDWIAVTIAGAREPLTAILADTAQDDGGAGSVPLVGRAGAATPIWAALINGSAGHALDYDDVVKGLIFHPTAPVLPAALSAAVHNGLGGAKLLDALVAGSEVNYRLGMMMGNDHYKHGWHNTGTLGTFGAAGAVAYLLGLDTERTAHALALAGGQAAGLKAMFGTMAKPFHAGKAAQNGYLAAMLAANGFEANPDAIEADQGFWATQAPGSTPAPMRPDPAESFGIEQTMFKYHAACYGTHSSIEACRILIDQHGFDLDEIERVRLRVDTGRLKICNIGDPNTGLQSKFSLRHTAAMALTRIDTGAIDSFDDTTATRGDLAALRDKVEIETQDWPEVGAPKAEVVIELNDGRVFMLEHNVSVVASDLDDQWARLADKFRSLVAPILGADKTGQSIDLIDAVGDAESVLPVMEATR